MLNKNRIQLLTVTALLCLIPAFVIAAEAQYTSADMRDAALIVGNTLPFGPTDGILRYSGRGAFIDDMISAAAMGGDVTCCMAFGPDENLYVSSPLSSKVLRFNGVTGAFIDTFIPAGRGGLVVPLILLFHDEYLYVGDTGAGAIRRYDAKTGAYIDNLLPDNAEGMGTFGDLQHFAFGPDKSLYVAAEISKRILRFNGQTGVFIGNISGSDDGFSPSGLTFGPDGLLYVASYASGEVRRYDIRTVTYDSFIPAGGTLKPFGPVGIVFGPDGNFYATSVATSEILRYDDMGRFLGALVPSGIGGLTGPRALEWKVKTRVCHLPSGNIAKGKTLSIGYLSARDHLQHGDSLGPCQ
jgi:DNA-binding beta-propeller fold protein YncE